VFNAKFNKQLNMNELNHLPKKLYLNPITMNVFTEYKIK